MQSFREFLCEQVEAIEPIQLPSNLLKVKAKYKLFDKSTAQKFINAVLKKCALYMAKDFKGYKNADEMVQAHIKTIETFLNKSIQENGSLPYINDSVFMTDPGDAYHDVFASYSLSYKVMTQISASCTLVAEKMGIIPKDWYKFCEDLIRKYDPEMNIFEPKFFSILPRILCSMNCLNDDETFFSLILKYIKLDGKSQPEDKIDYKQMRQDIIDKLF